MIKTIGVIGAGQMGNGIAHVFALHNHPVILCDLTEWRLASALATIRNNLYRQMRKGLVEAGNIDEIINRIFLTTRLTDLAAADFVVESVPEDEALKVDIFRKLDEIVQPGVVIATNSSSISISRIAEATAHPERVIGMHFMNPAPVMELVEIIAAIPPASGPLPPPLSWLPAWGRRWWSPEIRQVLSSTGSSSP